MTRPSTPAQQRYSQASAIRVVEHAITHATCKHCHEHYTAYTFLEPHTGWAQHESDRKAACWLQTHPCKPVKVSAKRERVSWEKSALVGANERGAA